MKLQNLILIAISLILLLPVRGNAQSIVEKQFIKKYRALLSEKPEIIRFNSYQALEKIGSKYVLKTFNPDKRIITHYETYASVDMKRLHGKYREWYDNGKVWKDGAYKNAKKSGKWKYYHYDKGDLYKYGSYKDGVEDGTWYTVDSLGRVTSECNYVDGTLDGDYLRYDSSGKVYQKIIYSLGDEKENLILDSISFLHFGQEISVADTLPIMEECADLEGEAREKCGESKYLTYVYKSIKYPARAREEGIQGKAMIRFVINKKGKVEDITVLRGICKEIEKECIRIIKSSPKWKPGIKDGEFVKTYFNMPVKFRLE